MSYISTNKQSFGQVAKDYKKYRGSYNSALFKKIISLAAMRNKEISILDLGCGVGNSTEPLYKAAKKLKITINIVGCDPDIYMLKEAASSARRLKLPITYVCSSAEKMPFEDHAFDLIISGAAFHWFANKKALNEIKRVLKKDGVYVAFWVLQVKNNKPAIGQELYKAYKWKGIPGKLRDLEYIKTLFKKSDFKNVGVDTVPFLEKKTLGEELGNLRTNSTYALLSVGDKKEFMKGMRTEYKKVLGKNKTHTLFQEINICYGYK
jgi:ubiquinone/menaquinone biosynthesis C-methylase UbiE